MEKYPKRGESFEQEAEELTSHEEAVSFLLDVISATVYSSGENYRLALRDFFAQLESLGHLIGASDLHEISAFIRRRCRPF